MGWPYEPVLPASPVRTKFHRFLKRVVELVMQVANGLASAHEKEITHRDIKPANIMITEDGFVKIVDFGLAKLGDSTKITKSGMAMGTPAYMSPEQVKGTQVDHRSDIWSLGIILMNW